MAKGISFSVLVFIFSGILFITIFSFLNLKEFSIKKHFEEKDIEIMLNTIEFIKSDLSNFLEISIPRILNSIISYEIENGIFIENVSESVRNAFFYSSFFDKSYLIQNSSLIDYETRVKSFLGKYNINISIVPTNFEIFQSNCFKIKVRLYFLIDISYVNKRMKSVENIEKDISIIGFEDPFYVINSNGLATNFIRTKKIDYFVKKDVIGNGSGIVLKKAIVLFDRNAILNLPNKNNYILVTNNDSQISSVINQFGGVIIERNSSIITVPHVIGNISNISNNTFYLIKNGIAYNVQNLKDALENQLCFESSEGGSFLDRLEGRNWLSGKYNLTYNAGLECFVNKDYLILSGLEIYVNKTNIDYIYFSNDFPISYKVSGFDKFYIDANHIEKYQLNEIIE